ncbi:menaquinone biosynthetic enzyme MqnA/MqnD family protein [Desulfuribacillus alkaliarsenatis]|uniref:Chorismate dehydratase n=1 Tax=Desulfuribacillus alkaliarsenatis TaxID=766136 RepID=A0A1E5G6B9_9FIRM|nr:menaquinone biosynthesis protein [Desulfuribacillus alkaliarsenatis]OEF98703.1 hypothetical protein BHF68_03315 [Desulfuribacillus alkaliarsenatis]
MDTIKIGRIDFLNILPIYYYLDQHIKNENIEIINKVPSVLNRMLKKGEIDMGPISSFSYAENADDYLLLPNLSVSSKGKVRSIYLFSKKPIESLHNASIALTNTSETSINLLKIILEKYYNYKLTYTTMSPDLNAMLLEHDAALLIGDDAFIDNKEVLDKVYRYDLGELWEQITGLSMTFAVWAIRKDSLNKYYSETVDIYNAFITSKAMGQKNIEQIINIANRKFDLGNSFWEQYYSGLLYDLNTEIIAGLDRFFLDAYSCGYLQKPVTAEVWSDNNVSS